MSTSGSSCQKFAKYMQVESRGSCGEHLITSYAILFAVFRIQVVQTINSIVN